MYTIGASYFVTVGLELCSTKMWSTKNVVLTLKWSTHKSFCSLSFVCVCMTHPDVCDASSTVQRIVGQKSPEARWTPIQENATGCIRRSWCFWHIAFHILHIGTCYICFWRSKYYGFMGVGAQGWFFFFYICAAGGAVVQIHYSKSLNSTLEQ